ncbi:radical SAM protein, partial [Candidatus Omnitrophota bacterium]
AAGLDSIRVSLNSVREEFYLRYYLPRGYTFKDVLKSIRVAKKSRGFVSVNYLTMPGFTDLQEEFICFKNFIENYRIDMIQWRSLNFDPLQYFRLLRVPVEGLKLLGVREVIAAVKQEFPQVIRGYFNPSRLRIKRNSTVKNEK